MVASHVLIQRTIEDQALGVATMKVTGVLTILTLFVAAAPSMRAAAAALNDAPRFVYFLSMVALLALIFNIERY